MPHNTAAPCFAPMVGEGVLLATSNAVIRPFLTRQTNSKTDKFSLFPKCWVFCEISIQ